MSWLEKYQPHRRDDVVHEQDEKSKGHQAKARQDDEQAKGTVEQQTEGAINLSPGVIEQRIVGEAFIINCREVFSHKEFKDGIIARRNVNGAK